MRRAIAVFILLLAAAGAWAQDSAAYPAVPADTARSVPVPSAGAPRTGTAAGTTGGTFPSGAASATTAIPRNLPVVPFVDLSVRSPETGGEVAFSLQLLLLLTVLSLAPSLIILVTSFLRVSIVLDFVKRALALQQVPPSQVLMGIALFLTLFIMWPTFDEVYTQSLKPLADGQIGVEEAYRAAEKPFRLFMYSQMRGDPENIRLFMSMRGLPKPESLADVPTYVLVPAFILSELTIAFKIGILLYIPFIIIDMVVASVLMSMGMIMLPPVMISTPFKLILFVLVDGWNLMARQLIESFMRNAL
ncbi:MAG TPA: flagellar type III secretion system pore protein FliP [Spirochaetia bacterium]|nr:flagellar type III secretion system pore protein FliP [Spirochaetales bacterium]HRW22964.1 flagellar type III secretion system pore protein FliP [Spirochaetia bacterium]